MQESCDSVEIRLHALLEDFRELGAWSARLQHLVEVGKNLPAIPLEMRVESNLIPGCLSKVWMTCSHDNGILRICGDAEAIMPRALVALVVSLFSGLSVEHVAGTEIYIVDKLDLRRNLTPTRVAVLEIMINRVQHYSKDLAEK